MEADFAALKIADQTSHQMAPSCAQAHHVGSQSTPPLNVETGAQVGVLEVKTAALYNALISLVPWQDCWSLLNIGYATLAISFIVSVP